MLNPENTSHTVIPAFIAKLWHMVEDPTCDDLISWGRDGTTFIIKDHNKFSSDLLPMYYKHNNMASFIRQLNMYSFHKVLVVESSSLKNQNGLEFSHPYFNKGQPEELPRIQRKIHTKEADVKCDPEVFNSLLQEVKQLRAIQEIFTNKLTVMKKENAALWREHSILRQRHSKQEKIVNKVIHFLISMVHQSSLNTTRRKMPLMIKDRPLLTKSNFEKRYVRVSNPKSPPIICEIEPEVLVDAEGKIVAEEITPEELLEDIEEEEDEEDAMTLLNKAEMEQQAKKAEPQPRIILKAVKRKSKEPISNRGSKRAKTDRDNKSGEYILPVNLNKATAPVTNSGESTVKPRYIFVDNGNGFSLIDIKDAQSGENKNVECNGDSLGESSSPSQVVNTTNIEQSEPYVLSEPGQATSHTQGTSYPVVSSPATSIPSPVPSQTMAGPANSSETVSLPQPTEEPTTPNQLLQLAIPSHDNLKNHEDAEVHLDKVQSDLDFLKDLLKGEGISLDANMIYELFNENPIDLNMGPAGNSSETSSFNDPSSSDQALMSYTPSLLDFENDFATEANANAPREENVSDYELNTPKIRTQSPSFPDPL